MKNLLIESIEKKVSLSDDDIEKIQKSFSLKKIRKRDFLIREGIICNEMYFVNKGCMILYMLDDEGKEHVTQMAVEGWWIGDMYSYLSGIPSQMYLEALEATEVFIISKEQREQLLEDAVVLEKYFRILLENNFIATHRRLTNLISKSAEQKYLDFMQSSPQFLQRIPQRYIASFLGMTPETLSRVRLQING